LNSHSIQKTLLPGATLGVLGSGQLGRMFAIAAKRMGFRVHVFSPDKDSPAGQVSDLEFQAPYDDLDAVAQFAGDVDVITLEFENIPATTIEHAKRFAPVYPDGSVLHTVQHRLREKTFLKKSGIPVADFRAVRSLSELYDACSDLLPSVIKTTAWGYDGKGQAMIRSLDDVDHAWERLETDEAILEELIEYAFEFSVVAIRNGLGETAAFAPIRNDHANHILDVSTSPSGLDDDEIEQATQIAFSVAEKLDAIGVICVEFFRSRDGRLIVNEIAPRPHNSGHLTIEAHVTSQFEQQVRAVCGLPLGSTRQLHPAAMVNLLGDCWTPNEPDWQSVLNMADVKLHLYGKSTPKPGRKMGHLTCVASTTEEAAQTAKSARNALQPQLKNELVTD